MSFSKDQILRMYSNTQYYIKNSNGGLLAGTMDFNKAKEYADEFKKEYLRDKLNRDMEVFVINRNKEILYKAENIEENFKEEEFE